MANTQLLRIVFAAIGSFVLFAALIFMPFAPVPVAAIGLSFGVAQAAMVAALAIMMTAIILSPPLAMVFAITFLVPTIVLVRQALLSRQAANGDYIFFPLTQLIMLTLGMTGIGASLLFLITGGADGLPVSFANAIQQSPEVRTALMQVYGISSEEEMLWIANVMLVSGFAGWPLLLLGNMQIAQTLLVRVKRNLLPQENHDTMQLPRRLVPPLAILMDGDALLHGARNAARAIGVVPSACRARVDGRFGGWLGGRVMVGRVAGHIRCGCVGYDMGRIFFIGCSD